MGQLPLSYWSIGLLVIINWNTGSHPYTNTPITTNKKGSPNDEPFLVGRVGVEPTRSRDRRILSPLRLPFRHHPIYRVILYR